MFTNAKWITAPQDMGEAAVDFIKKFSLTKKIKSATLAVTSVGVYEARINGKRVTEAVLTPGITAYKKRILYQVYDVTALLGEENTVSVEVGQGWAVGHYGVGTMNHVFFDRVGLIASLDVTLSDGSVFSVKTDTSWDVYTSSVTFTDIYNGETRDLTHASVHLGKAVEFEVGSALVLQDGEWIMEQERLSPVELIVTPKGERVIDFGQNLTGYVEIKASGKRGDRIVLHHAEVLDSDGNFYTGNYRQAKNEVTYVLSGESVILRPTFSFQGFRYVKLTECPDTLALCDFTAVAVYSDMKRTGNFRSGNEKINQLYHNVIWGQRGNFLDIPTDCPQRDERLGWTGDAQVFCRTASINYDTERFFTKWLADMALEQTESGAVPRIVPNPFKVEPSCSSGWGDAACIIPYELYLAYGDKELLKKHLPMMKNWVKHVHGYGPSEFLWLGDKHFGDWLGMDAGPDSYVGATDKDLIASAYFARSTKIVIDACEALGECADEYRTLYDNIVSAFRDYFMQDGMPKNELPLLEGKSPTDPSRRGMTQTAISLILNYNLCTNEERPALAKRLCELIDEQGGKMMTGFIGTPEILHALSDNGYIEKAYSLLLSEKNPSWLYSVIHGATTMWEHWNGIKEDGSFWSDRMNSFNHYAYGAVYAWIFDTVTGIRLTSPAYKTVDITPHPSRTFGFAEASIDSRSGTLRSHWYYKGDTVHYEVDIPDGVTATLKLPSGTEHVLTGGSYLFAERE